MSGLEALGAFAAVAQLLAYAVPISSGFSDIRARIRGGPDRLQQYERQIKELEVVTARIDQNGALQGVEIKTCLVAILDNIEKAKKILTKFQQSPRAQQHWALLSGALTRKLDLLFVDIQKSMDHLTLMAVSGNAENQQAFRIEIEKIATPALAKNTTASSSQHVASMESGGGPRPECTLGTQLGSRSPYPLRAKQTGSTFRTRIKLGDKSSADQGNKVRGITEGGVEQEGSTFEGEIETTADARVTQGNEIDGQEATNRGGVEDVME